MCIKAGDSYVLDEKNYIVAASIGEMLVLKDSETLGKKGFFFLYFPKCKLLLPTNMDKFYSNVVALAAGKIIFLGVEFPITGGPYTERGYITLNTTYNGQNLRFEIKENNRRLESVTL